MCLITDWVLGCGLKPLYHYHRHNHNLHNVPYLGHLFQSNINAQLRCYSTHLTHTNEEGKAAMVDVSDKKVTIREATAKAKVTVGPAVMKLIKENNIKKGDVLTVSQLAGITGAKKTSELIPLCHNIALTNIEVNLCLNEDDDAVFISATVKSRGVTGVEMEALMAVSISALTIYDMCKAVTHNIIIDNIELVRKSGGSSGDYEKGSIEVRPYETSPIIKKETVFLGSV